KQVFHSEYGLVGSSVRFLLGGRAAVGVGRTLAVVGRMNVGPVGSGSAFTNTSSSETSCASEIGSSRATNPAASTRSTWSSPSLRIEPTYGFATSGFPSRKRRASGGDALIRSDTCAGGVLVALAAAEGALGAAAGCATGASCGATACRPSAVHVAPP